MERTIASYIRKDRISMTIWSPEGKRVKKGRITVTHPKIKYGEKILAKVSWVPIDSESTEETNAFESALNAAHALAKSLNDSVNETSWGEITLPVSAEETAALHAMMTNI